jgi:hypothetical protein
MMSRKGQDQAAGERLEYHLFQRTGFFFVHALIGSAFFFLAALFILRPEVRLSAGLLLVLCAGGTALTRRLERRLLRSVAVHENGLVVNRRGRTEFIPWSSVRNVSIRETRDRYRFPYYEVSFRKEEPVALNPITESRAVMERIVDLIVERSGLGRPSDTM